MSLLILCCACRSRVYRQVGDNLKHAASSSGNTESDFKMYGHVKLGNTLKGASRWEAFLYRTIWPPLYDITCFCLCSHQMPWECTQSKDCFRCWMNLLQASAFELLQTARSTSGLFRPTSHILTRYKLYKNLIADTWHKHCNWEPTHIFCSSAARLRHSDNMSTLTHTEMPDVRVLGKLPDVQSDRRKSCWLVCWCFNNFQPQLT